MTNLSKPKIDIKESSIIFAATEISFADFKALKILEIGEFIYKAVVDYWIDHEVYGPNLDKSYSELSLDAKAYYLGLGIEVACTICTCPVCCDCYPSDPRSVFIPKALCNNRSETCKVCMKEKCPSRHFPYGSELNSPGTLTDGNYNWLQDEKTA